MSIWAKKSLGQNFLKAKWAIDKAVEAGKVTKDDTVLEIGPGEGALTAALLEKAGRVIVLEKDDRLIPILTVKFAKEIAEKRLEIFHEDAVTFSPEKIGLKPASYKLIANIPYYITGLLLQKFTSETAHPNTIVFMVQKEVAERIVSRDGKESILSISVKAYGEPKYIATVGAGCFVPQPSIDSALIAIENISKDFFGPIPEETFFKLLKKGFAHKRKKLTQNLEIPKDKLAMFLSETLLDENIRPEKVLPETWKKIAEFYVENVQ